jgi:uncharacterized protein HemX
MTQSHLSLLEKIVFAIAAALGATILYAMDWQREQDANISGIRELQKEQKALYTQQKQLNESILNFNSEMLKAIKATQGDTNGEYGASTANSGPEG